jgi:hypothetical protein
MALNLEQVCALVSSKLPMESLPYVDALVKEYLLFRGFTKTFQSFCDEAQEV